MATVAGIFDDRESTERALSELYKLGYDSEKVGVIWRDRSYANPDEIEESGYEEGHFGAHHSEVA